MCLVLGCKSKQKLPHHIIYIVKIFKKLPTTVLFLHLQHPINPFVPPLMGLEYRGALDRLKGSTSHFLRRSATIGLPTLPCPWHYFFFFSPKFLWPKIGVSPKFLWPKMAISPKFYCEIIPWVRYNRGRMKNESPTRPPQGEENKTWAALIMLWDKWLMMSW